MKAILAYPTRCFLCARARYSGHAFSRKTRDEGTFVVPVCSGCMVRVYASVPEAERLKVIKVLMTDHKVRRDVIPAGPFKGWEHRSAGRARTKR